MRKNGFWEKIKSITFELDEGGFLKFLKNFWRASEKPTKKTLFFFQKKKMITDYEVIVQIFFRFRPKNCNNIFFFWKTKLTQIFDSLLQDQTKNKISQKIAKSAKTKTIVVVVVGDGHQITDVLFFNLRSSFSS
jgi:hypothetical protein